MHYYVGFAGLEFAVLPQLPCNRWNYRPMSQAWPLYCRGAYYFPKKRVARALEFVIQFSCISYLYMSITTLRKQPFHGLRVEAGNHNHPSRLALFCMEGTEAQT